MSEASREKGWDDEIELLSRYRTQRVMNRGTSARSVSLVIVFLSHLSTGAMIPGVVNRRYVPVRVRVIQLT